MNPGVICILVRKSDGHIIGSGVDFEKSGAAGFSQRDNQERRARGMAKLDFIRKYSGQLLFDGIDSYMADRIVEVLLSRDLISLQIQEIGYEDVLEESA